MSVTAGAAALLAVLALVPPAGAADGWTIEDTSRIGFVAYQRGQPVQGGFEDFAAEIAFDPEDLAASRIVVEIDTTSITTGHGDRDATLRSSQFFATDQWPSARFESEELVRRDGDAYEARGSLTIRDLTRDVVLPFELAIREDGGGLAARAEGELIISRLEFGIGQGEWASTETVGEDVTIHIAIDATRPR